MSDPKTSALKSSGLAGITAGSSAISQVDPTGDKLTYRGYDAHELAENACFEEVAFLLVMGHLPSQEEFKEFNQTLVNERKVSREVMELFTKLPVEAHPMDRLRTAVSFSALFDPDRGDSSHEANVRKAFRLIAKMPALVAGSFLVPQNKDLVESKSEFSWAKHFLILLRGEEPDDEAVRVFDASLILYAEHGFNASTFAGRVTMGTLSDIYSGVTSSIGTLKGPLHGGANEKAMEMLIEIGEPEKAEAWVREALAQKKKIMGFGHRVYKVQDSRAPLLKKLNKQYSEKLGNMKWYEIADIVEKILKEEKNLFPNVDFPCASLYYLLGLPVEVYTPIFAAARTAGWCAHDIEQSDNNRLIRPECDYVGERDLKYIPLENR